MWSEVRIPTLRRKSRRKGRAPEITFDSERLPGAPGSAPRCSALTWVKRVSEELVRFSRHARDAELFVVAEHFGLGQLAGSHGQNLLVNLLANLLQ